MSTLPISLLPSSASDRVESALHRAIDRATASGCPPRLAAALRHAVFPGGGRLRPELALLAATASGDRDPNAADGAAAAIELIHCASLVHDDLPCFDDAATRRGRPSVHAAFGEALAVLAGDALIVHAFAEVARGPRASELVAVLAEATGAVRGIVAGQAWESEPAAPLDDYHRAKTASLFVAAGVLGATAAGGDPAPWRAFGDALGRAYQAADDLADAVGGALAAGKPTGQDVARARPSVVRAVGVPAASARVRALVREAEERVPHGRAERATRRWLSRLVARAGLT